MKVYFETFGCRLNRAEALEQEAQYLANGWQIAKTHHEADLFIVRGCSVTARAQRDCEKTIDHLKRHYPTTRIIIEGCLPDAVKKAPIDDIREAPIPTRTARAYLKVQDGCNGKCTFCIVPKFRGHSISVDFNRTLDRAKKFIESGYHEIVVTGCNLSLYASQGKRLPELTNTLATLDPNIRIRLGSVEPGSCAKECVSVMAENDNICRFLHLPIQSGSNTILSQMQRGYTTNDVDDVIKLAIEKMPLIGLGCDIMTGFPGESDIDYMATKGFLKRNPFSNIHVFPYSERPGTFAVGLPCTIPRELRKSRAHELAELSKALRTRFAKHFIGKDVKVLIEDADKHEGWTSEYLPCKITALTGNIKRKEIVKVQVTDVHGERLQGRAINA